MVCKKDIVLNLKDKTKLKGMLYSKRINKYKKGFHKKSFFNVPHKLISQSKKQEKF